MAAPAQDDAPATGLVRPASSYRGAPGLVFDGEGRAVGGCRGYRAHFAAEGLTYLPAFGRRAPRPFPVALQLQEIVRGGQGLTLQGATPTTDGLRVTYDRGSCSERYDLRPGGVALSFRFPEPVPGRGDLTVRMRVDTELAAVSTDGDGVALRWPGVGGVDIGGVVGIDAGGRHAPGRIELHGDTLELSLAGAFLEAATWPVVLDPLIRTRLQLESTTSDNGEEPDIAWEARSQRFCVVWEEWFAANSADVRARIVERDGTPVLQARCRGFSLHAATRVAEGREDALERLCRYVLRPALDESRLAWTRDGKVVYRFKRPWKEGTKLVGFEPLVLIERLAALVPRPHRNLVTYHGAFAPAASHRERVVLLPPKDEGERAAFRSRQKRPCRAVGEKRERKPHWRRRWTRPLTTQAE